MRSYTALLSVTSQAGETGRQEPHEVQQEDVQSLVPREEQPVPHSMLRVTQLLSSLVEKDSRVLVNTKLNMSEQHPM